jgi:hypothetical protein
VKTLAARNVLALAAVAIVAATATAPAVARRHDTPDPMATPTLAPLYALNSPPPTVMQPSAIDACANDAFLADRTIPIPMQSEVTVCGIVIGSGAPATGRGVSYGSFMLDVDGSDPIGVVTDGPSVAVKPGDIVVVRGRYHRENGGAEGINQTHTTNGRGWAFDGYIMVNGTIYH